MSSTNYGISNANQIIFPLNAFNNSLDIPTRYRSRLNPFEIQRGSFDEDTIEISLPDDYQLEAKPNTIEIIEKFGTYKMEVNQVNPHKLVYNRSFLIKKGFFEKTDYDSYRKFIEQIAKADNSKIIIIKK